MTNTLEERIHLARTLTAANDAYTCCKARCAAAGASLPNDVARSFEAYLATARAAFNAACGLSPH